MVDHQPGVAKDVPREIEQRRHGILRNTRLLVLQAEQVNGVDEHEAVLGPIQDHLHRYLTGVGLGEDKRQYRAVHVVHLDAEDCGRKFTRLRCQQVNLSWGEIKWVSQLLI